MRAETGRHWCERGDSNPHALRHWNLNPGRLPIPPLSRGRHRGSLSQAGRESERRDKTECEFPRVSRRLAGLPRPDVPMDHISTAPPFTRTCNAWCKAALWLWPATSRGSPHSAVRSAATAGLRKRTTPAQPSHVPRKGPGGLNHAGPGRLSARVRPAARARLPMADRMHRPCAAASRIHRPRG